MAEPRIIALAGNPNVGKSTLFNALTGLRQHTGNWPGKTVEAARGLCRLGNETFTLIDVPGAYSLWAQSAEEEAALEAVCLGGADAVIVVCDALRLERNLNLVYQVMEMTPRLCVCVNCMDEAEKQGVRVDLAKLEKRLGVPVTGACARKKQGLKEALAAARQVMAHPPHPRGVSYPPAIEKEAQALSRALEQSLKGLVCPRFAALRLMEGDRCLIRALEDRNALPPDAEERARRALRQTGLTAGQLSEIAVQAVYREAEKTREAAVSGPGRKEGRREKTDGLLTGPWGIPVFLVLLGVVFYLTLRGANAPSAWLSSAFAQGESWLRGAMEVMGAPPFLTAAVTEGVFRTLGQVISVMLPPMAVFFPLFSLLEDSGYLPRAAFLADRLFERSRACGKQALTMCMGFGCNAVGVMGCRIIDSPRERLIAMLTNSLMPCNGRFPTLIAMLTLFFAGSGTKGAFFSALMLLALCLLAGGMTLLLSSVLSRTLLKGVPSFFTLELPPLRRPQLAKTLVRSLLDRTVFVLGRAAAVAAPAGLIIFLMNRLQVNGASLLAHFTAFLDPAGRLMGLDGAILTGFLLGFPANEIVLPIILMAYAAGSGALEMTDLASLGQILSAHGWTALTGLNVMLFSLFHFPCSTTVLTLRRESGSWKWAFLSCLLPTLLGAGLCMAVNGLSKIL